ncbi:DUF4124 domain-containing protein [Pseudomonas lopnurensis]|uniref:DUF4124 domain-containing protein n=1 Tax=Pseudomonas lopnurensis TaxID=1477517 RepID=UPI00187B0542|nr:DUF4124 domain-containing protein [Pseudomonas lopnurensis]MBE7374353.1 DUF4124 domain-containing protein [Pseudomonas lopnurensis]
MRSALFGLLLILTAPAIAEIYKYTDERGNTVFTNQPPEGVQADAVELPPANTVNIRTPEPPPPLPGEQPSGQAPYQTLIIAGIPDEEALRANNGSFVVSARLEPPLQRGHRLRFLLDGIPQAAASTDTSLQLNNVDRGEHRLQVEVLSGERVIQRSDPEHFTVQRVHTSSPALRPRPAP